MIPQDSPTPPAPAEVCERLQLLYDHILDDDCLKDAIALIEQGEKERERLDWLESARRALFTRDSSGIVKFDAETSATDWHCVNAPTLRAAIDAARAQPSPESK